MRTLIIGRSRFADVILPDESVAPRHAELVITDTGRHHLTDCASGSGTFRRDAEGRWVAIRQAYVAPDTPLRFARHETDLATLLRNLPDDAAGRWQYGSPSGGVGTGGKGASDGQASGPGARDARPAGRVERDPVTGEIIRRGL